MNEIKLLTGDCREVLKDIPDNSIDSVVTDPPYELGFMGKKWDASGIAYDVAMWREVLRVLKPGGFLLSFGGTRTYHRMVCAIEDAGFEIRDSIDWVYGQGFPKSLNIEKLFCSCGRSEPYNHHLCNDGTEKKPEHNLRPMQQTDLSEAFNPENESGEILQPFMPEQSSHEAMLREESKERITDGTESCMEGRCNDVQKEGQLQEYPLCESTGTDQVNGTKGRLHNGAPDDNGDNLPEVTEQNGSGASFGSQPGEQLPGKSGIMAGQFNSQKGRTREICERCGKPFPPFDVTGFGTSLKPAFEPVTVARKPIEGTVAENVLKWGTGGINIDACRIGETTRLNGRNKESDDNNGIFTGYGSQERGDKNYGRFPANFIHDGSEEVLSLFPVTKSGLRKTTDKVGKADGTLYNYGIYGDRNAIPAETYGDTGSAARFFKTCEFTEEDLPAFIYCAKASKSERDEGCDEMDVQHFQMRPFAEEGCDQSVLKNRMNSKVGRNNHPTVKPVKLMQYLVKLVTPPDGTVLDPFMGSGTTGVACKKEGFNFVGIEMDADHFKICEARINNVQNQANKQSKQTTLNLQP